MSWKRGLKWIGGVLVAAAGLVLVVGVVQVARFGRATSMEYSVGPLDIEASLDSAVIERGRHLAAVGGCLGCHRPDLSGGLVEDLGPIGVIRAPNLTVGVGGVLAGYTDGDLARAIRHGIRPDGRSLLFMPTPDYNWWPDEDLAAIASYVRSAPGVDSEIAPTVIGLLGKVLSQFGVIDLLSAETVDHDAPLETVPAPEPTSRYGAFLARGCIACHGERLSGGKIPGAPSSLAIPANLTPHPTGLGDWTEEQFFSVIDSGVRPDGRQLDAFMPVDGIRAMNETERSALWAYLSSVEPLEFGSR